MRYFLKSLLFMLMFQFTSTVMLGQATTKGLDKTFSKYEIVKINSTSLMSNMKSQRSDEKTISLNNWNLTLFDSKIISPNYKLRVGNEKGVTEQKNNLPLPMSGYTHQGGRASLTFNKNYIYGFVEINGATMYIEPLYHFVKNAGQDEYVVYNQKDIIDTEKHECGTTEQHRVGHHEHKNESASRQVGNCYEVEYAIASDWLMFQKYGNITGVENHAIGVTNNIQTNYDNEFADELKFIIVEQFVSSCSSCDPWTNSTNPNTLLNSFTNWGPGGFSTGHDVGSLWTDRDLDGSVIGIAWLGAICTNIGYNTLQDFSSNANLKRVMVSHELGHNFDASHDASGSPFIMAPAVQNTNQWSSASITDIQNYYNSANCLSQCSSGSAPNAQFTYTITEQCAPGKVQFNDQSTGTITQWNWVFEGGTPATSTQQNPLVTYNDAGIYNVSLTVISGSLNNTLTLNDEIEIITGPFADFNFNVNGSTVEFFNTSTVSGATTYSWDFGDNSTSTDENPTHTYTDDGTYTVVLEVTNDCGSSSAQFNVVIATPPTANFLANQTVGCATFSTNFTSTSSNNTVGYSWVFQGGTPATSTLANPVVSYPTPGSYPVSLTVSNAQGTDNKTVLNYIVVNTPPSSSFTFTQSGLTFSFASTSSNATSLLWDFGDGNTSTLPNPVHTFATAGNYTVFLTADNALCPESVSSQGVNATSAPLSLFTASANSGCASFTTTFTSTSTNNPTSYAWSFPGGNPSSSTLSNPEVTYASAGSYDVTLVTTNSFGSNTLNLPNYINVSTVPVTDFTYQGIGLTYNFASTAANAISYAWDFGDGNLSSLENPTHSYVQEGNYDVKLITTNLCGETEKIYSITVLLAPVANAQSSVGDICANEAVTYTDASTGTVVNRTWTFEGGSPATSSASEVNVAYTASGSYNVRLIVENSVGKDTIEFVKNVTIKPTPVSQFTWAINSNVINLYLGLGLLVVYMLLQTLHIHLLAMVIICSR
jgi:PKD repeat protein